MNNFIKFLLKKKNYAEKGVVPHWPVLFKHPGMIMAEMSSVLCPNEDIARYFFRDYFIRLCREIPPVMIEFDEKKVMEDIENREKIKEEAEQENKRTIRSFIKHLFGE